MSNPTHDPIEQVKDRRAAEEALSDLRTELAELCGYHEVDNAIPLYKIRALLDGAR